MCEQVYIVMLFVCLEWPKRGLQDVVEWWFVIPRYTPRPSRRGKREGKEGATTTTPLTTIFCLSILSIFPSDLSPTDLHS